MRLHLWGEEVANVAVEHKVSLILTNVQHLRQRIREIFLLCVQVPLVHILIRLMALFESKKSSNTSTNPAFKVGILRQLKV